MPRLPRESEIYLYDRGVEEVGRLGFVAGGLHSCSIYLLSLGTISRPINRHLSLGILTSPGFKLPNPATILHYI